MAARHKRPTSGGQIAKRIIVVVLLLIFALGCALFVWGLLGGKISFGFSSSPDPTPSTTTSASQTTTTTTASTTTTTTQKVLGVGHYKQQQPKEWNLLLVNSWNVLPDGYEEATEFVDYDSQNRIDARVKIALEEMLSDGSDHGLWGILLYRDGKTQQEYFDAEVADLIEQGYSATEAEVLAANTVIRPGTSEHQTGLAVDILGSGYTSRDEKFEESDGFKWLQAHCAEYGFILRYPKGKEEITGMDYEPWHYRYVGKEYAKEIMSRGLTLEEFLEDKGW